MRVLRVLRVLRVIGVMRLMRVMRVMSKETRIGFFTYFEKIMFNASILFKTTKRVIILNILTTYKTLFTYFSRAVPISPTVCTPYIKIKAFYIYF